MQDTPRGGVDAQNTWCWLSGTQSHTVWSPTVWETYDAAAWRMGACATKHRRWACTPIRFPCINTVDGWVVMTKLVMTPKDMDMGVYIISHQPFWSRILPSSRLLGPQHGETSSCSQNPCSRPRAACVQSCMELASSHIDNNNTCWFSVHHVYIDNSIQSMISICWWYRDWKTWRSPVCDCETSHQFLPAVRRHQGQLVSMRTDHFKLEIHDCDKTGQGSQMPSRYRLQTHVLCIDKVSDCSRYHVVYCMKDMGYTSVCDMGVSCQCTLGPSSSGHHMLER